MLPDWLAGWLVGWLAGWLVGWFGAYGLAGRLRRDAVRALCALQSGEVDAAGR